MPPDVTPMLPAFCPPWNHRLGHLIEVASETFCFNELQTLEGSVEHGLVAAS